MKILTTLAALLIISFSQAQTITFGNRSVGFCISNNWLDPGTKSGASPSDGFSNNFWSSSDASKKNCFETDTNKTEFGWLKLNCFGVSPQGSQGTYTPFSIIYNYVKNNGDTIRDSISLTIYPLPVVVAGTDVSICQNSQRIAIYPAPNIGPPASKWVAPSPDPTNPNSPLEYVAGPKQHWFYPQRAKQDTTYVMVYQATTQYNGPNASCTNQDTAMYHVRKIPVVDAGPLTEKCDVGLISLNMGTPKAPTPGIGVWSGKGTSKVGSSYVFNTKDSLTTYGSAQPNVLQYCFTNDTSCTVCDTMKMVVNKLPNTDLQPQADVCETVGTITLHGNQPTQGTGTYYVNDIPGTQTVSTILSSSTPCVAGLNKARYRFTDINGCYKDDSIAFSIKQQPEVEIVNPQTFMVGQNYTLLGRRSHTTSIEWTRTGDGIFTNGSSNGSTSTDTLVGYYAGAQDIINKQFSVKLTSTNNGACMPDVDSVNIGVWAASVSPIASPGMHVFPNPSSGIVRLQFADVDVKRELRILDLTGRERARMPLSDINAELDMQQLQLAKGLYFFVIEQEDGIRAVKVLYR